MNPKLSLNDVRVDGNLLRARAVFELEQDDLVIKVEKNVGNDIAEGLDGLRNYAARVCAFYSVQSVKWLLKEAGLPHENVTLSNTLLPTEE